MRARVLIVEDNGLVALEIVHAVRAAGLVVSGPARDVNGALELIACEGCDAAILDINLGKETSEAVAFELKKRQTPFLVVSAYSRDLPLVFRDVPALTKPIVPALLIAELMRCINHPKAHLGSFGSSAEIS